jgi:hypothetical protein
MCDSFNYKKQRLDSSLFLELRYIQTDHIKWEFFELITHLISCFDLPLETKVSVTEEKEHFRDTLKQLKIQEYQGKMEISYIHLPKN